MKVKMQRVWKKIEQLSRINFIEKEQKVVLVVYDNAFKPHLYSKDSDKRTDVISVFINSKSSKILEPFCIFLPHWKVNQKPDFLLNLPHKFVLYDMFIKEIFLSAKLRL